MNIAIISDLHGNLEALEAFDEIYRRETYDELWVLGDLVNYGPNPREVVSYVREHAGVVIRGNHDHSVGCNEDPRCSLPYKEMARATGEFTASALSAAEKAYLGSLPLTVSRMVDGKRFVLCHATPSDPLFEYVPPDSPTWISRAERVGADVLLAGHTHMPFVRAERGRIVGNPGSLGQPKTGNPNACFATWDGHRIELRTVAYPCEKTIAKLDALALPSEVVVDLAKVLRTGGSPG